MSLVCTKSCPEPLGRTSTMWYRTIYYNCWCTMKGVPNCEGEYWILLEWVHWNVIWVPKWCILEIKPRSNLCVKFSPGISKHMLPLTWKSNTCLGWICDLLKPSSNIKYYKAKIDPQKMQIPEFKLLPGHVYTGHYLYSSLILLRSTASRQKLC